MDQDASGWKTLLTRANQLVRSATHPAAELPVEGHLPGFDGATGWVNSEPLTAADLRGRVVLVNFWTYTCINWLRALPYVRAWADRYQDHGLVVIGVHTPEFGFEHDLDNVRREVKDLGVDYRSRSTTTTRSGPPSTTTTGRRCTSSTLRARSATTASARATTRCPRWSCNSS
jgi:thiol-disulfide isomerase/thioredoxin